VNLSRFGGSREKSQQFAQVLARFDRHLEARSALIKNESMWTLNSGNTDELAQTAGQIDRVQLAMTKLSRELASVSRQIRALMAGKAHCVAMPAPAKRANLLSEGHRTSRQGSAFAAVNVENGPSWCASGKTPQRFGLKPSTVALKPGRRRRVSPPC